MDYKYIKQYADHGMLVDLNPYFEIYETGLKEGWMVKPEVFAERSIGTVEQDPLVYGSTPDARSWRDIVFCIFFCTIASYFCIDCGVASAAQHEDDAAVPGVVLPAFYHWRQCGSSMLIFLSSLKQIPTSLYEASKVDGASAWHQFWKITFPLLTPTIFFNLVMQMSL